MAKSCRVLKALLLLAVAALPSVFVLWNLVFDVRLYIQSGLYPDDAYYYFQVAYNLTHGHGLTFDGINLTNGFQPLWLMVITPIFLTCDKALALHAVIVLQSVMLTLSVLGLCILGRRNKVSIFIIVPLALLLSMYPPYLRDQFCGLETGLYVMCSVLVLVCLTGMEARETLPAGYMLPVGALLALLNLARTDSVIFSGLVLGFLVVRRRIRPAMYAAIPLVLVVGSYLLWNYLEFGDFMPVSGAAKRAYAESALRSRAAASHQSAWWLRVTNLSWPLVHETLYPYLVVAIINALAIPYYACRRKWLLFLFQVFLTLKFLTYGLLYYRHAMYEWYYAVDFLGPVMLAALVIQQLRDILRGRAPRWCLVPALLFEGGVVAACLMGIHWYVTQEQSRWLYFRTRLVSNLPPQNELEIFYLSAIELRSLNLPKDFIFGMNNSGIFGYYCDNPVVNFDGLINGRVRLAYIKRHSYNFWPYLDQAQRIDAYIDFIQAPALASYDRPFVNRGFLPIDIGRRLTARYGQSPLDSVGAMRMYVKSNRAACVQAALAW